LATIAPPDAELDPLARYRTIFEGTSVGIVRAGVDGRNTEANPAMARMLGYTSAELVGMDFQTYTHADDVEHSLALFRELMAGERDTYQVEKRCYRKDGKVIWTHVTVALERDENGRPAFAISMLEDITERREAELRYRALIEQLPLVTYIGSLDLARPKLYVSPQIEQLLGYPAADWLDDPDLLSKVVHPDDWERVLAGSSRARTTAVPFRDEYRCVTATGDVVWVMDETYPARDERGEPCVQGYLLDISNRKQAELSVRASEALVRAVIESALDAVITIDEQGRILEFNPAAEATFGRSQADVIGFQMAELLIPPSLRDAHNRGFAHFLATGEGPIIGKRVESIALRADGTEFPVELAISRVAVEGPPLFTGYVRDISEQMHSKAVSVGQTQLLEAVAAGAPLHESLDMLTRFVEEQSKEVLASILLLDPDGRHLRHGAAPSLSEAYTRAIDGIEIGPSVGSCGTAAYRRETVIVSDIENDPLWSAFRELALDNGLQACWSTPIFSADGTLLGTLAFYYPHPGVPTEHDLQLADAVVHVASLAIERSRSEAALRKSEERYRDLFENASEPVATVDLEENLTEVNSAFAAALGYKRDELLGGNLQRYLTPDSLVLSGLHRERKLAAQETRSTYEQTFIGKSGRHVILEVSTRLIEEGGVPVGVQGTCRDITARKESEKELLRLAGLNRHQALHDQLTGLPNRMQLHERIEQCLAASRTNRNGFALMMIDLDRFKEINDSLGHHSGDDLLREIAGRLQSAVRTPDIVARLGGDEFGVLMPGLSDGQPGWIRRVEEIKKALEEPVFVQGIPVAVEASIGISFYPAHGDNVELLLQRADVAMYVAKHENRGHATYNAQEDDNNATKLSLLGRLRHAIDNNELVLHYQPILDLHTGTVSRVEALVRWQHPSHGFLLPSQFIPIAERTALIKPLTRYVLDDAVRQCKQWEREGHALSVAVNLSTRNLAEPDLVEDIAHTLSTWRLDPGKLLLEITESAIMSDPARTEGVLRTLRASASGLLSTTSGPAIPPSPTSPSCLSTRSRSIGPSSPASSMTTTTEQSSRQLSICARTSVCRLSPRASRLPPPSTSSTGWTATSCRATSSASHSRPPS
jgi:diguanylate cyclase (GGDEF)-like protein/PAS domain S-box-containing protein